MPEKVMMFNSDTTAETVAAFKTMNFTTVSLDANDQTFYDALASQNTGGTFYLFSHGDEDGPMLIDGDGGDGAGALGDDGRTQLADAIFDKKAQFYCMSCNTGRPEGKFCKAMVTKMCAFVAPNGYVGVKYNYMLVITPFGDEKMTKRGQWMSNVIASPGRTLSVR